MLVRYKQYLSKYYRHWRVLFCPVSLTFCNRWDWDSVDKSPEPCGNSTYGAFSCCVWLAQYLSAAALERHLLVVLSDDSVCFLWCGNRMTVRLGRAAPLEESHKGRCGATSWLWPLQCFVIARSGCRVFCFLRSAGALAAARGCLLWIQWYLG